MISLGHLDDFFSLGESIYSDIWSHYHNDQNDRKEKRAIILKLRDHYRHISVDNVIGDMMERTLRSSSASN